MFKKYKLIIHNINIMEQTDFCKHCWNFLIIQNKDNQRKIEICNTCKTINVLSEKEIKKEFDNTKCDQTCVCDGMLYGDDANDLYNCSNCFKEVPIKQQN